MSEWRNTTIGAQATLQRGFDITAKDFKSGAIPVISSGGIAGYHHTAMVKGPGVVLGRKGTLGTVFFVDTDFWPHDTTLWVKDFHGNDPRFVYYFFKQLDTLRMDVGSANPTLNRNHVHPIAVKWPDIEEQRAIAKTLAALDDKIELSRRMNETLEAIARAIFAKIVADAEPEAKETPFSEIAEISRESVNPGEFPAEVFEHYSIPAYDEQRLPTRETGEQIKSNKFIVHADSVLLSKLNPRIPRVWLPSISRDVRSICSTEFLVLRPKPGYSREFIYGLCSSAAFREVFAAMVTGTSGSHQRVKPEYLEKIAIGRPASDKVERFTNLVRPLHARVAHDLREDSTLAVVRDTLLPKLISGEIRLKHAEKALARTV